VQSAPLGLLNAREQMHAAMTAAVDGTLQGRAADVAVDTVLDAQQLAVIAASKFGATSGLPFSTLRDRDPLPGTERIGESIRAVAPHVPLLLTYTRDDGRPFVAFNPRGQRLARQGALGRVLLRRLGRAVTARVFGSPASALARTWRDAGGQAQVYRIDWSPEGAPFGAAHCIELPLLFGSTRAWQDAPMLGRQRDAHSTDGARALRRAWADFAHAGRYPTADAPAWLQAR
jgi:para-nitrobenzyl esterase